MMYPKRHTPKQSRFQFALEGVGSFSPPKRSIFNEDLEEEEEDEGKADETFSPTRQDAVKEEEDIIIGVPCEVNELQKQQEREEEERRKKEAENKVFLRQYGIKVIQDETEQNHTQTTTKTSGRIQFTNIVVPPDAPKDLICEECEQRFSSYYCSACRQVFCYQCADLCHPRVSANTLQHEHEADGFIRAVRYGDVSKVKLQNEFYLPDHEVYPEEFARVKALEQPNTLLTNPTSAKRFVLQPSRQLAANKPLYKVNDLVLFKDPVTAQKAYGKVISEYDELNGKVSAPAIFRGEDSNRYYMVQMIDLLVHTDELQTILLQDEHYLEEEKKKKRKEKNKSKPFNPDKRKNHGKKENKSELNSEEDRGEADKGIDDEDEKNTLIPELSYDCMKDITDKILILNQRIQEYSNRILLGPKYHLRNLNFPKGIPFPINPGPPEGDNDAHSMASSVSSHASQAAKSGPSFLPLIQIPNQKQSSSSKPYNSNTGNIRAMIHKLNQDENSDTASSASSYIDDLDVNKLHFHRHSISQLSLDQQVSFQNIKKQREKFMLTSSSLQQLQLQQKRKGKLLDQVAGKTDERKSLEVLSDITAHDYQNDAIEFAERSDGTYANKLYYQQQSRHHQRDFHHLPPIQQHLKRFQQQYQKDMQQVSQEKRIDYDLYANINNLDDDSVLSYYNQHQLALPALHRSPEDYVMQSTIDAYKTSHYFPNLPNAQIPSRMFAEQLTKEISTKLLNILLLPEKDIETTFVQYLEDLQQKKKSLLNNVFSKTELIYLKAEVFMKFQYWKKVIRYEKRQKYILAAKKIQRNVRVWLCRNVLDDLRLYYHNIEVEKHRTLHRKFRYCGPDHPYAVSVDGKLFFETHADLNRYIYFIRVMILKVIKYLTIKKLNFYQTVFKIWKSAIYEFKESDMTNQHISTELVHLDRAASSAANVPMEELKKLYISEQEQLLYRLLTKNPEDRPRPMRSRNMEETTGVDNELFANLPLNPFPTSPPMKNSLSPPTASPLINSKNQQDKENEWGVLITPTIQFIKNYSEYKRKVLMKNRNIIDEKRLLEEKIEKPAIYHNQSFLIDNESNDNEQSNVKQIILSQQQEKNEENVKLNFPLPSYNPSFNLPLPILPIFTRGANFHDRLYYDVIQQQQPSSTLNTLESLYYNPSLVNAYQREYRMYKHQLEGPTSESYWLIPSILMIGNVPFGPAIKKRFDAVPPNFHDSLSTTSFLDGNKSKQLKDSSKPSTNNSSSRWKSNSNELTAISALLLAGIDTFVSMLSEKEENILQSYYQSEYTIETMIHTALEHTKTLSNRIIADHLLLIQKQEQQLLMIPTFGKSDPRYPQAYQEKLRCQGRITFYQNVINTIKNQIKLLPKELYFYRLVNNNIPSNYKPIPNSQPPSTLSPSHATSEDGTDLPSNMPWTTSQILPSVWFIEQLIRDSHTIYLYSGSYHHQKEDGPTKDGLSGTIGSIVMGRLYHLKGLDAIFQWQKCHDFMQILQLHEPKHSMTNPFLPEKIKKQFKKTTSLNNEGHDGEDGEVENRTGKRLFQEELEKYQKSQQWKIKNLLPSEITHNSKEEREKEEDGKENTIPTRQVAATSKELAELSLRRLQDHLDGKVNPTIEILQKHGESYLYRTSCPPTAWQKSLILDCLTFSHEWINYPIVRSQITPEIYTILERNHYDITLRNQNLSLESLQDYYTSQQYLPISLNNTASYSNFITDEKSKRNLIRSTTNHHTMNQTSMMKIPSTSSISSSSSFSINTESSKSHGMSGKGTIKQLHSKDVIIRGDVIQEEENEEDDKINSIGAFSVNSTASMKSSSMKGRAAIMVPKTGKAPRMTMLQRMKQQVAEEELAEEQRLEKERLEKEAFESKEFNEAQRQEMIMTKLPVQRIQQSVYQQPPQQGLPRQQTASTIVTGRVLSSRSTSSKYSK